MLPAKADDYLAIAVILWDLDLFFEVHEILEPPWIKAQGDRKLLLQALIRAAGVYINLELGYTDRAAKISSNTGRNPQRQFLIIGVFISILKYSSFNYNCCVFVEEHFYLD